METGNLIRDNYGRTCIVGAPESSPPDVTWLNLQDDKEMKELPADTQWFTAYPLTGGAVCVPEPLCWVLKEVAKPEDLDAAIQAANPFGRKALRWYVRPVILAKMELFDLTTSHFVKKTKAEHLKERAALLLNEADELNYEVTAIEAELERRKGDKDLSLRDVI